MTRFLKLAGRRTGKGAYTAVQKLSGDVEIVERNFSRTGNHWDIYVYGTGVIDIIDVSNSGKHYCERVEICDGEIAKTLLDPGDSYWDTCPICEPV